MRRIEYAMLATVAVLGVLASSAAATPSAPPGFTIAKVAAAPAGATNCDDLGFLAGNLFMGCQNMALSDGGGGNSTLVEVSTSGAIVHTWSIKDKIDGLAGDPVHNRVIVTLNEDAHSHLATVSPSAPAGQQVVNYSYNPAPDATSAPPALQTGGGTDNVTVDANGNILITGSHAKTKGGSAVFVVTLAPPSSTTGTGTATLHPTWADNATAQTPGGGSTALKLTDVDSGTIVPAGSPGFGGSYVIDDQTALELVFAKNIFAGTGLTVVKTPYGLDDIRWLTSDGGTLYLVDLGTTTGHSVLYKVTGPFKKGTVLASNDSVGDQVVTVDPATGKVTPFLRGFNTTKGLVYVDPSGTPAALSLTGAPKSSSKSGGSSNTGLIIGIIAAVLVVLAAGGFFFTRRG